MKMKQQFSPLNPINHVTQLDLFNGCPLCKGTKYVLVLVKKKYGCSYYRESKKCPRCAVAGSHFR